MEGGFPGQTPFGYSKIDKKDHELEINKQQAAVIQKAVERILSGEDPAVQPIWEDLQKEYAAGLEYFPAYGSLLHILRSKKYTGEITHDGEVVGHIPQIISKDDYERVIEKIGTPDNEKNDELDHVLRSIIDRFGIDGSINLFDIMYVFTPRLIPPVSRRDSLIGVVDRCIRRVNTLLRDGLRAGDHPVSPVDDLFGAYQGGDP